MAGLITRRWRVAGILVGLAFAAVPVSSAMAATTPTQVQVGPLTTANGYKATFYANCNSQVADYGNLAALRTSKHYTLGHYYYDNAKTATACKTSSKLGSGSLTVKWGKFLHGKLKFSKAGHLRRMKAPKGCTTTGHYRNVTGTGTLTMAIHVGKFGKLVFHSVKAQIQEPGVTTCKTGGPGTQNYVSLFASWKKGKSGLSAIKLNGHKHGSLSVFASDNLSKKVQGSLSDQFYGSSKLFNFKSNLSSATVGAGSPFLSGSLKYKATTMCSAGTTTGKMSGKLVLHDPVTGAYRFPGKSAEFPYLNRSNGTC